MKKLIAFVAITTIIASCSVINSVVHSSYKTEIAFWSAQVGTTTLEIANQSELAFKANKAGKTDSALLYSNNVIVLGVLLAQYKDSLIYYVNLR